MRNLIRTFVIAALALAASRAYATPATCTITELDVAGTFPFFNIGGVGLAHPGGHRCSRRDVHAASRRVHHGVPVPRAQVRHAASVPSAGSTGIRGRCTGTIDSNGQIVLPNFGMRFWTDFTEAGVPEHRRRHEADTLRRGIQAATGGGPDRGCSSVSQLGADGMLRLVGTGLINFQLALQTGTGLTCRLVAGARPRRTAEGAVACVGKGQDEAGPRPHGRPTTS